MHPAYTDQITQNKCLKKQSVLPRNLQNSLSCPLPCLPVSHPNFKEVIMDKAHPLPVKNYCPWPVFLFIWTWLLSSLSGVHSRKKSDGRRQSMEGALPVCWICLARDGARCPRAGAGCLLQDVPAWYSSRGWRAGVQQIPRGQGIPHSS